MKLKHLEMTLQQLDGFVKPRPSLEQYQTPAPLAARLLYHAFMRGDIAGKTVCDLGCGTGMLAIGASLLGAHRVIGVEIDPKALDVARKNTARVGAVVEYLEADIQKEPIPNGPVSCDTVIMNPPFGAQKAHADRPFIDCALRLAPVTYGIFNAGSMQFITAYIQGRATIDEKVAGALSIRRTFSFHTRDVQEIEVEILRLVKPK